MTPHLSTLALHQLRYGELPDADAAAARDHLSACAACSDRLAAQERERAAFVARPVPPRILAEARASRARAGYRRWAAGGAAVLALAASALFVTAPRDEIRTRGELPEIEAWVDRGHGPEPLDAGGAVAAGDRVSLKYDPHGASAVAIAGRDSTGEVEVYTTNAPTGVGLVEAPFGLQLDDTPGTQELFVLGSDRPLSAEDVEAAVTEGVDGVRVSRVALEKRQ
jgi:anti-sigma factor RsiW